MYDFNTFGSRRVFFIALIVILVNFYLRICFRFLAAMRIRLLSYGHPVFLTTPILFALAYSLCHYIPICKINVPLHHLGLSLYCIKSVNPTGLLSDYHITWIWFASYLVWSLYFIAGESHDPSDEM